jgi:hypothetical protein
MQNTTSAQDALLAIGSVCNQLPDGGFERYMQHFVPLLVQCINAVGDARLSVLAITVTADVARAMEGKFAAFSDPIVEALLLVHGNSVVDSEIHQVDIEFENRKSNILMQSRTGPRLHQTRDIFLHWRRRNVSWWSNGQVPCLFPADSSDWSCSCCCYSSSSEGVEVISQIFFASLGFSLRF